MAARYPLRKVLFWGKISFLKAGLVFADAISTVSKKYAQEIQTPEIGEGLDGLLRARSASLTGVLKGIDDVIWNPETDPHIAARYSVSDLSGKRACKLELLREMGLSDASMGWPLIGIVSRRVPTFS